jgi:hypothetical protein
MGGGAFISELCVALEHRWKPEEIFLLFTAYFDEADTHGAAPPMVMAAFLGYARQWKLFQRRLKNIQQEEGFKIFHGKEVRALGQFKAMRIVHRLTTLVKEELTEGACIYLEHARYMNEYRASPTPTGISLDSQYGVCFRMLLRHLVNVVVADGKKHRLHVVVERGHNKSLNTETIFNKMKQTLKARGIDLLGTWTLAAKEEAPPLMAADLLAHTYALMRRPGGMGIKGYADSAPEPPKGEAGLTFLEIEAGALHGLKLEMQRERWIRRAYARSQKEQTRRLSSVGPWGGGGEQPC